MKNSYAFLQLLLDVHVVDVVLRGLHLVVDHLLDGLALRVEALHLLATQFWKGLLQTNNRLGTKKVKLIFSCSSFFSPEIPPNSLKIL